MAFNYIAEINALISSLKLEGRQEVAGKLQEAMDGASTGTELLFRVRYVLQNNFVDENNELVKARVKILFQGIGDLIK